MIQKQAKKHKLIEQKNAELLKENEALKGEHGSLSSEKDDLRQSLNASEEAKETLTESLKHYKKQMKLLKSETGALTTKLEESEHKLSQNREQEEALVRKNKKLKKLVRQAVEEQHRLEDENSQLIVAVDHLRQEIERVKQSNGYGSDFLDEGSLSPARVRSRRSCRLPDSDANDEAFMKKKMALLQRELDSIRAELMMSTDC